jgi:hypothetical protein
MGRNRELWETIAALNRKDKHSPSILRQTVVAGLKNPQLGNITYALEGLQQESCCPSLLHLKHARHVLHQYTAGAK